MSRYHLHARLHEGPLSAPSRSELQLMETDALAEIQGSAKALAADGFTVWVYDHGNPVVSAGCSNYRTILMYHPDGQLVDYRRSPPLADPTTRWGRQPPPETRDPPLKGT